MQVRVWLGAVGLIVVCPIVACGAGEADAGTDADGMTDAAATGSSGSSASTSRSTGSSMGSSGGSSTDTSTTEVDTSGETGDVPVDDCDPFGRWPAPRTTFTLPATTGTSLNYPDLQASFPEVDWSTLDRLYVPAGQYLQLNLGNLPERSAERPLVITNLGGQVRVGPPEPDDNYLWSMSGGSNWVLTGRWDPDAGTGDASAVGHRCSDYAQSRGNYGFWSDDAFSQRTYLHMGLTVSGATGYEIEFVEIERSGFAGIRLLNAWDQGELPMADVRVHDNYVHDVDGEGIYFGWTGGPPSNITPRLEVYNNRFVRTGNEALQIQDIGDGSSIHHNVIAWAALHWRDNDLGAFQDGNAQISIREGEVALHHNLFVGAASALGSFWSQPQDGDGDRTVVFHDNVLAASRYRVFYFGGESADGSSFVFADNFIFESPFTYDAIDPGAAAPSAIFRIANAIGGAVSFEGNTWEGTLPLLEGGTDPMQQDNVNAALDPLVFVDSGYPEDASILHLEAWTEASTRAPGSPPREYVQGDLVTHDGQLYRCIIDNTGQVPSENPAAWSLLPAPVDDLRVVAGSPYAGIGIE